MLVRRSRGGWGEHVVVAVVAPIEMGAGGSVPDLNPGVVRSVNDDGEPVTACEHVCVLFVSPFTVSTQGMSEIVSVGALESAARVPVMKESRQVSEQVTFDTSVIRPTNEMP